MKFPDKCPDPVIYFLAGSLPITAHIHKRQLSLFGMICRLPENILHKIAARVLWSEPDNSKSWFINIRQLCVKYCLPSPLTLLQNPPSKIAYKRLISSNIVDFWENYLRSLADSKPSLKYFKSQFMSLTTPHPIFTSCQSNVYESNKSLCQAALISGRYKTNYLARHWTADNPQGLCGICPAGTDLQETIEHFLLICDSLHTKRSEVTKHWLSYSMENNDLNELLVKKLNGSQDIFIQFVIDPSSDSDVISGCQLNLFDINTIFKLTRTWCYSLHRKKQQLLG